MTLDELPDGSVAFVDSNIFIYHFTGVSVESRTLLERCERRQIRAITGTHILLEVLHRLMMIEAVTKGLVSANKKAQAALEGGSTIEGLRALYR